MTLITEVRAYIEDLVQPYAISDTIILRWLNKSRHYIDDYQVYPEDYPTHSVSPVYNIGHASIMNLILEDAIDGNVISESDYTVDYVNGIITFDSSPLVIPSTVYATFTTHDIFEAVAELWKYRAALATTMSKSQIGDETLPEDKNGLSYCMAKYWSFRKSYSRLIER